MILYDISYNSSFPDSSRLFKFNALGAVTLKLLPHEGSDPQRLPHDFNCIKVCAFDKPPWSLYFLSVHSFNIFRDNDVSESSMST